MNITLTLEQYEALASFARSGQTPAMLRDVDAFLKFIEETNGIKRSFLWVQWQEANSALPPTAQFPLKWPPEMRVTIERTDRPVARADVEKVLSSKARKPVTVLVTTDPGGELGWMAIDEYFRD